MPYRKNLLVTGEIYHIFNRSVAREPIFINSRDYKRALELIDFYRFTDTYIRFSFYNRMKYHQKSDFIYSLYSTPKLVDIFAFCFMPNHFHFLVKQNVDGGITKFIRIFQNSYAKYLNTKIDRPGAVFQAMFKTRRIESEEQLLHVFRYINLNPVTGYVIPTLANLNQYPWCSYADYTNKAKNIFLNTDFLNKLFKNREQLEKFHSDQVNYQRTLKLIEHLLME